MKKILDMDFSTEILQVLLIFDIFSFMCLTLIGKVLGFDPACFVENFSKI